MPKQETRLSRMLDTIFEIEYERTETGKMIVQRQRNELKYNLLDAIVETLIDAGIPDDLVHRTTEGYILELQNSSTDYGYIPVEIDIKIKNLDFDLDGAIIEWKDKVAAQKRREEKKRLEAERKAKRDAERKSK